MATKATNRREVDDASLEAFRAVQHVIERTESQGDKQLTDAKGLKQRFDAAHRKGMKAIKRGDLKSFGAEHR